MITRRTKYGWMMLGGLICLFAIVMACKLRDGNRAMAQSDMPLPPDVKQTAEPPLPRVLPPLGNTAEMSPAPSASLPGPIGPETALPPIQQVKAEVPAPVPLGSDARPIVVPAHSGQPLPGLAPPPAPAPNRLGNVASPPPPSANLMQDAPPPHVVPAASRTTVTEDGEAQPLPLLRARPQGKSKTLLPLTGTYPLTMDANRGLTLPKDVQDQLGGCATVLLSPGSDKCLWLTNQAHLDRLAAKLDTSPARESDVRTFKRLYFAQVVKADVKDGYVVASERLARFAGLSKDVVLVGIDDHFEIWDATRWRRYTQTQRAED